MPGNTHWCQSVNEKQPIQSSPVTRRHRFGALLARLQTISTRGRVVGWLLMFVSAYRLGLPVLFSAALAGLPWLLLKPPPVGK